MASRLSYEEDDLELLKVLKRFLEEEIDLIRSETMDKEFYTIQILH